jgi:nitrite reductase/ring-hydroxylating ferredoxin subunit
MTVAFFSLEKLINMHDGYRKQFVLNRQELLLAQHLGEHFIMQANCPHRHWPLQAAVINEGVILCKKHGMSFNLTTGQPANSAAYDCKNLKLYNVAYEGNSIGIDSNELL